MFDIVNKVSKRTAGNNTSSLLIYIFPVILLCFFELVFRYFAPGAHLAAYHYLMSIGLDSPRADFYSSFTRSAIMNIYRILLVILGLYWYHLSERDIGWKKPESVRKPIIAILSGLAYVLIWMSLFFLVSHKRLPHFNFAMHAYWTVLGNPVVYYYLIIRPFVNPVFEELFYRGFIQGVAKKRFGVKWAIVLTAVVFTASHDNNTMTIFIGHFLVGLIYGFFKEWDGSLLSSISMHCSVNTLLCWFSITTR